MTQNAIAPVDQLWRSVRREAESVLARDPLFGAALRAAILDHSDRVDRH
jgi:serine O-acetyltransferase